MFPPQEIFDALFRPTLARCFENYLGHKDIASSNTAHNVLRGQMLSYVAREFATHWTALCEERSLAAEMHRARLEAQAMREHWGGLSKNTFCAICIVRRPEHVMKCRHSICDLCVEVFGVPRITEEYTFTFPSCLCCGKIADLLVRLKPPTAGLLGF